MQQLRLRVPIAVIGACAVALTATGVVAVSRITALTRDRVHQATLDLVEIRAKEVEGFFRERGRVVRTVFADPAVLSWFEGYDVPRRPLEDDAGWQRILELFRALPATDPTILSVFFATDSTGEYFRNQGRVEREGYDPRERWWWSEALDRRRLYVSPPGVDVGTGDLVVTIQSVVHAGDGRLLGVGGIDVLLGTLGSLVEEIRYQGVGHAFLVDELNHLIYFPRLDLAALSSGNTLDTQLTDVDRILAGSAGFHELAERIRGRERGLGRVRWNGEERIVVFVPVRAVEPELDWTLGLMVPEALLGSTITRARWIAGLAVAFGIASISGLTLWVTIGVNRRLREQELERSRALAEANARLLEADHMKSLFLATMSHELRTPLNSIIGFSEVLRSRLADRLEPRFLKFLDNIHASGTHLLTMISDILDLSKIEAGRLELRLERLDVERAVQSAVAIVQGMAREREIGVATGVAPDLPSIEADPVRLEQVLLNLLSNAVKFSPDRSEVRVVAVHLEAPSSPLGVDAVAISVSDSGPGIAPEHQALIFEHFRQVQAPELRRPGGTGLGLAVVRHLVELHQGSIRVASRPGAGATFTVTLPVERHGALPDDAEPVPE